MQTILSVDDDTAILRCFQKALGGRGYRVFITDRPEEAVRIVEEEELDLVMLDVKMPRTSGFQIFKQLKKKYRTLPVLFVTAYPGSFAVDAEDIARMWQEEFADGNTDMLYKPFDLDTLYEKVEGLIGPAEEAS
jgi:DNA-binding response OmpR family regulator